MKKTNYLVFCKKKTANGYIEKRYNAILPEDYKSLRLVFGEDVNTKENTIKVYKNGVCYTNDKKLGYSVRYIPIRTNYQNSKRK